MHVQVNKVSNLTEYGAVFRKHIGIKMHIQLDKVSNLTKYEAVFPKHVWSSIPSDEGEDQSISLLPHGNC